MENFVTTYGQTYDLILRTTKLYCPDNTKDNLRPKDKNLQEQAHYNLHSTLLEFNVPHVNLPETNMLECAVKEIKEFLHK